MSVVVTPLGMPWRTPDPFLFCVHHVDAYPAAGAGFGPAAPLTGRQLGQDFAGRDGWNMYHGRSVPGFPPHPHRGFETLTLVRRGLVDHSDSLGATARFGAGDVQWLTAGRGIVHAEMFPLLDRERPNPLELFQIWLNLPAADKMAEPHFSMLWSDSLPRVRVSDAEGRATELLLVAGAFEGRTPPAPPPRSWAARPEGHVVVWVLDLAPGARFVLPEVPSGVRRTLQVFRGEGITVGDQRVPNASSVAVSAPGALTLVNGPGPTEILVLGGRPIGEPVAAHGPFVMNTREQIETAFADYRRTRFGGWPWPTDEPVHGPEPVRFARYPDGTRSTPRG